MGKLHPAVHGIIRELLTSYGKWLSDQQAHPVLSHKAAQDYACDFLREWEQPDAQKPHCSSKEEHDRKVEKEGHWR